jgi:hypothetical protein
MLGREKTHIFIFLMGLAVIMLLGPPLAMATSLPAACNIFHNKKAAKLGSCWHNVNFSEDKLAFGEMAFSAGPNPVINQTILIQNNDLSFFSRFVIILNSEPLRC